MASLRVVPEKCSTISRASSAGFSTPAPASLSRAARKAPDSVAVFEVSAIQPDIGKKL
ncbi:hypothetical protein [Mesorhizobium sp. CCNWLY176]|uniref:hypothetical protein n=1 Tax=Mesorhizobium sp. CCNWLY176 TaxID=3128543 RepID=UPI00301CEA25